MRPTTSSLRTFTVLAAVCLLGILASSSHAAVIDTVRTGEVTFTVTQQDVTLTPPLADSSRTILWFETRHNSNAPQQTFVRGTILNGSTLRFNKNSSGTSVTVRWYASEFASGVTVQRGTTTQSSATVNAAISPVTLSESFVLASPTSNDNALGDDEFLRSRLTSTTNLEMAIVGASGLSNNWQVVSMSGATVQRGILTLASGSTSTTQAITSVDTTRSFVLFSYSAGNGTTANIGQKLLQAWLSSPTQITFQRNNSGVAVNIAWEVVQLPVGDQVQERIHSVASGNTQTDVTIGSVNLARSIAFSGNQAAGGIGGGRSAYAGDDISGVASWTYNLLNSTTLRLNRNNSADAANETSFVVQFAAANSAPVLASIGPRNVNEGVNLNFNISASDPDLTTPTLTAQGVPANATFSDNGNGTGTFNFNPSFSQSGVFNVLFIASDGTLADSESVAITVVNVNQAPVLATIGPRNVNEGTNLNFVATTSDGDGTTPTLVAQNVPTSATFVDHANGTGTFNFNPDFTQSGVFNVRFIASDGALADTELVAITVNNTNRAPVLAAIGPQSVNEGVLLTFGTSATDPDATTPALTVQNAPAGATYTDNGNGTATFNFTPTFAQAGVFNNVRFIASDGALADTELVTITVNNVNRAPILAAIGPQSVNEGVLLTFGTSASDPDATTPVLTVQNAPAGAAYTDNGNGTGTFNLTPTFAQAGVFNNVRFISSDGSLADTELVTITVNNVNQAPVLATVGPKSVNENVLLTFGTSATDADATPITMTAENSPAGAIYTDNGNGTATYSFTPTFSQSGVYNVRFIASDGSLADTELVAITVNNVNRAPVLTAIGAQSVNEGVLLSFGTSATDPDATTPILTAENTPSGATYTDNGNGTATFSFTPTFSQSGVYNVRFIASDGSLADTELVAITVNNVNQAPVLAAIGPTSVNEGVLLTFGTSASDVDATPLTMSAETSPAGATYTDNGNGTATFTFTPTFAQSGVYNVRFIVSDGSLADTELVAITVNNVNQAPVFAAIGPQSVNENANLNFNVSATDPDATTPSLAAENVPTNASFVDNGNGTGTFDFDPDFTQAGVYNVRFIASDGSTADTEVAAITVNNVNRAPVLAAIGTQSVNEGVLLSFGTSASDPDESFSALTAENTPSGATYTDNGNGTASFSFTPTIAQAGVYNVRFIASDGLLADTELVVITVNNVNQSPALAAIGAQSVNEGVLLSLGVSATDVDATTPTLTAENSPAGANFTDNGNGTGSFTFTPDFTQAGAYNVRFIASDGALVDTEIVAITVNNVNRVPVLTTIGAKSVNEGALLTFGTSATDPDATVPTLIAQNTPAGATYTDNGNGTASFSFTPTFSQAGVYNVRFIASDGSLADTELVAITVKNVNLAPELAPIGAKNVNEGVLLSFGTSATDPDATFPALTAENAPSGATYTDNGNGTASFSFTPNFTQSGVYNVRFIASDGSLADTELVAITVNNVNLAPVLAAIGPHNVNENANLNFNVSATDADGTTPSFVAENVPTNASFVDNADGIGTFDFTPDFTEAGVYYVRVITSDGSLADTEVVAITVNNVNRAPALAAIGAQSVNEGVLLTFGASATDPDGTFPALTAENAPSGATYTDNGNGTASFSFTPTFAQAGVYNVRFIASDGSLADTELVAITVNNVNLAPVLAAIGSRNVNEGQNLAFVVSATDPDATNPILTAENTPLNTTFTDNGNGTGSFDFDPDFTQAGVYNVRFIASDGALADTELVAITVNDVNRAPLLSAIGAQNVSENQNLTIGVSANDPDLTNPTLAAENVPVNATFTDNGNGTGSFAFDPDFTQAGVYNVRFIASDGSLADTEIVAITVNNVNRAPLLNAIGPRTVDEGQNLNFAVSGSDPDLTAPALIAENVPTNATFTDNGNGSGSFDFDPDFTQSGVYNVRFIATDGSLADTEVVAITVNQINLAPVLASIGPSSVNENANLNFNVSAVDVDATTPTLTVVGVPTNATYTDNGNGTGTFDFNPDFTQAGVYNVTFIASDGVLADSEIVAITVNNTNRAPVLAAIGAKSVNEEVLLTFATSASDPDATFPALTVESAPSGATYTDNGNGTASFSFTPTFVQSGVYNVRFIASDGSLADTEQVAITVNNVNQAPVLAAIGPRSVNEGVLLTFGTSATDFDATPLTMTAENAPAGATYTDNGNGTATFNFTPTFVQSGVYDVRFIVSDESLADTELVAITVNNVNQAPVLAVIGPKSANEGVLLTFGTSATDFDATPLTMIAQNTPVGATYIDNGNGTATFNFTPTLSQSGVYNVRFIASDGSLADTEIVAITVNNVNQAPVLAAVGPKSVDEGVLLTFGTSATDFDATPLTMTAENAPSGATYADNGNSTATFNFTPTFAQSGVYNVRFIVSDGSMADTELVAITVSNVNLAPVLASIGPRNVMEGANLNFNISATDADATTPTLTAEDVPTNGTFVDNGDGTGTFDFDPDFTQSGVYNVRFIVSDGALADTELVAITVAQVNLAPVLAAIGPRNANENQNLSFGVSASDPDATTPALTAENVPVNATYTDNGNGTGSLVFNPDFTQAGVYNVRFIASDGNLADTELVAITVNNVNRAPVLAAIGPKSVNENANLNFGVSATDPDLTPLTLIAENVPLNATFTDNGNGTGTFEFNPTYLQAGVYNVRFIATDGSLADSELVVVTVNDVNRPPVLATIGPRIINEGQNLNFGTSANDPDGSVPVMTALNLPLNANYTDHGNGTATIDFTPTFTQSGGYNVLFIASDGIYADSESVAITVSHVNLAPVLATIGPRSATEGQVLNFAVSATDADATTPALTAENVMANATFVDNGNGTGSFSFNPNFIQAGVYNVRFIASDGALSDSEVVAITVNEAGNQTPTLAPVGTKIVTEGNPLSFRISGTDPEFAALTFFTSILPTGAVFVDSGNGAASLTWTPTFTQSGTYFVTFAVEDPPGATDNELVRIDVIDAGNQRPVLASIGPRNVQEGANLNFIASATDADATTPTLSAVNVPANATFVNNGNGTGTFNFNAAFGQAGLYNVTVIASDGSLADSEVVAITVGNVNEAPILASIGPRSVNEGVNLNFGVTGADPDLTTPTLIAQNVPANATFTDNANGTGTFNFNPDFTQAGVFNVRFIASDGVLADTEIVAITVNNVNRAPVLATIGPKSVNEGVLLTFGTSATDPDLTNPALTAVNAPAGATYMDNGNGTATFSFTPTFAQSGVYNVTFIASDGSLADSEVVVVTVNNANRSPVLDAVGARSVAEGANLNFGVSASDPDLTMPALTAVNVPANASFVDNGNGTGTFDFDPDFNQAGVYNVTFIASDGSLADSEVVAITVTGTNLAPILASIGPRSVTEGQVLNFNISATDPDGFIPSLIAQNVPANASFIDNGNGTGTFNFAPNFVQTGVYNVRFIASDGLLSDTELVALTVNEAGNQAPVLAAIGPRSVTEGLVLNFNISATDPDATTPTFVAQNVPANASFVDNANGTGTFNFSPNFTQAGVYNVRFITSDGSLADTELVAITVNESGNQRPVLAAIGPKVVTEGTNLNFGVSASDPDATIPTLQVANAPTNSSFIDNGNGTGTFNFDPDFAQAGVHNVTFIATDGALADSEVVAITVNSAGNQRPVLAAIGPKSVTENQLLSFGISATDADATTPVLFAQLLPSGASFDDNSDGTGSFDWTPTFAQSGVYNVRFIATDGLLADTEIVAITVSNVNRAPVLAAIGAKSVNEGVLLSFATSASDLDATPLTMTAENTPSGATYADNGNGTASFSFTPTFAQSGVYNVRFIVSDGSLADTELVAITVNNANQAPVLAAIGPQSVNEGVLLTFGTSATDFDATPLTMIAQSAPAGATYTDNGNGTATFNFTPTFAQSGVYNVRFIASDGALADTEMVAITVNNVNQAPVLAAIGPRSGTEGILLTFGISASDVDATPLTMTAQSLPPGATYTDNGNGTATFNFTPNFVQAGIYNVRFIASDGALADSELVTITINESGNQAPVLASIGPRTVTEGLALNFNISATDPDASTPSFLAQNVPSNASFVDNGNGTGTFNFAPNFVQAGVYNVRCIATDGSLSDTEIVAITVNEAGNQRPVLASIGPRSVTEGQNLNFGISANDADSTIPTLIAQNTPTNSIFIDNGNGTGTFNFNPDFTQAGIYNVRFIATDGSLADTEIVAITVTGAGNQRPVLAPIGARATNENVNLNFDINAIDADSTTPILIAQLVPSGATFTNNGDGTGTFDWTPSFAQSGVYNVRFIATDGSLTDTEMVAITVTNVNRAPVLAAIGPKSVNEGVLLAFGTSATDPDATPLTMTAQEMPLGATYTDNANGTATFNFTPTLTQSGVYNVRFVVSDGSLADTELVAITVNNANQAPVLAAIGPKSVNEGVLLTFGTSATDFDAMPLIMIAQNTPSGATYTDNGNGTATFNFTPTVAQSGVYNVRFIASDGALADTEIVAITVNNVNQAPVLAAIGPRTGTEGVLLTFGTAASDVDATPLTMTAQNTPSGSSYIDNDNGTATFNFTPTFIQAGVYPNVRFIVSDGSLADTELVTITINESGNQSPVLAAIGPRSVTEGLTLNFNISASDPDATTPSFIAQNVPTNASFVDNGNGTSTFNFAPNFVQAGVYNVRFIATDGSFSDTEIVAITVNEAGNQRPVLAAIGPRSINEGQNLNFGISANDADSTIPTLIAQNTPTNSTFIDNGNGTGTFNFNPDFTQSGVYNVRFIATDGSLADTEIVAVTVNSAGNQRPVLATIGPRSVNENQNLNFDASATDADATTPTLIAQLLPSGATFSNNGDGTGTFDWTPSFTQSGVFNVRFIATDGSLADTEVVAITVSNVNRAPVLASIGPRSVNEGQVLNVAVSASDPDLNIPTIAAENVPTNASFVDNGNGTGSFTFSPDFTQAGVYSVRFITGDGVLADTELVAITVNHVSLAPVLAPIGAQSVSEGQTLNVNLSASDFDATIPTLIAQLVPANTNFTDNGNGTGLFTFTPDFTQGGAVYNVRIIASDGALADTEVVAITVNNVNRAPVLATIGPRSVNENANLNFGVSGSDPDGTTPTLVAQLLPTNASFIDNGNGTGTFNFSPDFTQAGVHNVRFITSDGALTDTEMVAITVNNINASPVLAAIGPRSVDEADNLNFNISATDIDATIPTLTTVGVPANASFVNNGNGTGTFDFTPDFTQSGIYNVTFIASDGILADSEVVQITVTENNRQPVADAGTDQGPAAIGFVVTLDGSGSSDLDGDSLGYHWRQVAGPVVVVTDSTSEQANFTPTVAGTYRFRLIVDDAQVASLPDTVQVSAVSQPSRTTDLMATVAGNSIQLSWSAVTTDTSGSSTSLSRYVVYRGTRAYFAPTPAESIGVAAPAAVSFTDNNLSGADVVGDTGTNYFYCLQAVDAGGGRSGFSNRVGEYDYQIYTTSTTDFSFVMMPFANTGITTASDLIQSIGVANVNTVNRFIPASQSYEARFAAGFGPNFPVLPGGIYQVNAKTPVVWTVAGRVPDSGTISYPIVLTSTTDFSFIGIPFERELDYAVAQNVIDAIPGVLNTLNRFIPTSQSYESRFYAGFGPNFPVKAGRVYQANARAIGAFPAP